MDKEVLFNKLRTIQFILNTLEKLLWWRQNLNQISRNLFFLQSIANGLNGQRSAPAPKNVEKVSKIIVEESYHILQMEKIASESQQAKNIATPTVVYHHGPMALQ